MEGMEYASLRELQYAALSALVTGVEARGEIIDHADEILEILSIGKEAPAPKEYSDDDYKRFAAGSGIPAEVLRRRVQSGKTLDQALAKPYTERHRKPKGTLIPAPTFGSGAQ